MTPIDYIAIGIQVIIIALIVIGIPLARKWRNK